MTKIEWTDKSWNPVTGCTKVSAGCQNCYAETIAKRFWGDRKFSDVQCHEDRLDYPLKWKKPQRIFVNSMSDLFHEDVPDSFIDDIFFVMSQAQQHTYQILTKRPKRMMEWMNREAWDEGAPSWAWLGVSIENQEVLDERAQLLLQTPAAIRFVSLEPLLSEVDLSPYLDSYLPLDWVIVGGESGHGARPVDPAWVHKIHTDCIIAKVPFFFKGWGAFSPNSGKWKDHDKNHVKVSKGVTMIRTGKRISGRCLDGRTWDEFPGMKDAAI